MLVVEKRMHNLPKEYIMKCPACNNDLLISERQGIEIDFCPACRGIWLDKGELDKIMERAAIEYRPVSHGQEYYKELTRHAHHDNGHDYDIDRKTGKRKKRGGPLGFLGELFD